MNLSDLWWLTVGDVLIYGVGAEGKYTIWTSVWLWISLSVTKLMSMLRELKTIWLWYHDPSLWSPILHDWLKLVEKHELIDEIDTNVSQEDKLPVPHKQGEIFAK